MATPAPPPPPPPNHPKPTPAMADTPAEESWAEIVDEEDNKTIEAFLATVENSDIPPKGTARGPPPPPSKPDYNLPTAPSGRNYGAQKNAYGPSRATREGTVTTAPHPTQTMNTVGQRANQQPYGTQRVAEGGTPRPPPVDVRP